MLPHWSYPPFFSGQGIRLSRLPLTAESPLGAGESGAIITEPRINLLGQHCQWPLRYTRLWREIGLMQTPKGKVRIQSSRMDPGTRYFVPQQVLIFA